MAEVASRTPSNTDRVTAHSITSEFSAAIQQGEAVESAAVKALQTCEKAGILTELRRREYYDKPSIRKKKKEAAARKRALKKMRRSMN